MLETVLAIIVGLIVLAGTVGVVGHIVATRQRTQRALNEAELLTQAIHSLYAGEANTSGISASVIANSGIAPRGMVNGSSLFNPWAGAVTFAQWQTVGYTMTLASVPQGACIHLLVGAPDGVLQVSANSGAVYTKPTVAEASAECTSSTGNTVVYYVESKDE